MPRPELSTEEGTVKIAITILQSQWEFAKGYSLEKNGRENVSLAVRDALEAMRERQAENS